MKTLLALCALLLPSAGLGAAITEVSAIRSVFANALHPNPKGDFFFPPPTDFGRRESSTALGLWFGGLLSDTYTNYDVWPSDKGTGEAYGRQRTTIEASSDRLTLSGWGYSRNIAEEYGVRTIGSSLVTLSFTIDAHFVFTLAATAFTTPMGVVDFGECIALFQLKKVLPSGVKEPLRSAATTGNGIENISIVQELEPGRYELTMEAKTGLLFPQHAPQSRDVTASIYDLQVSVAVPEPSAAALLAVAAAGMVGWRKRGSPAGA